MLSVPTLSALPPIVAQHPLLLLLSAPIVLLVVLLEDVFVALMADVNGKLVNAQLVSLLCVPLLLRTVVVLDKHLSQLVLLIVDELSVLPLVALLVNVKLQLILQALLAMMQLVLLLAQLVAVSALMTSVTGKSLAADLPAPLLWSGMIASLVSALVLIWLEGSNAPLALPLSANLAVDALKDN